jgi:hypothetical protein
MDPAQVRRQYPALNLHGTIGTQSTMPWGTPDEVRRVVRERIRACGAAGRLILVRQRYLNSSGRSRLRRLRYDASLRHC